MSLKYSRLLADKIYRGKKMIILPGKFTTAKIMIDNIEPQCQGQIIQFINHPAFTNPVAIMPDTHFGKGSVIGFTMKYSDKLIPNVVGVDIGCGMLSVNIGKRSFNFLDIDQKIREAIPFGINVHARGTFHMLKDFPWEATPNYEWFVGECKRIGVELTYAISSIGTLGGGNHFIEFGVSEATGDQWLTVHSGSRNFGKRVCDYFQKVATKDARRKKDEFLKVTIQVLKKSVTDHEELGFRIAEAKKEAGFGTDEDLSWLDGEKANDYLKDMRFAQRYAQVNRQVIVDKILELGNFNMYDRIETIHNFIDFRDGIIRKGAIRSYTGEKMIIPFNMRDGILLCEGKSNPEWNFSAPHGAGRLMSRTKAKATLNLETFKYQMSEIFSTSVVQSTLDEAPGDYKDPKMIEKAIEPTATILDKIKPIHNMKDRADKKPWQKKRETA